MLDLLEILDIPRLPVRHVVRETYRALCRPPSPSRMSLDSFSLDSKASGRQGSWFRRCRIMVWYGISYPLDCWMPSVLKLKLEESTSWPRCQLWLER